MILNQIAGRNFLVSENLAHALDMALIRQKNRLLGMLPDRLADAVAALEVVAEFWRSCDYGYKVDEFKGRIVEEIRDQLFRSEVREQEARGFAKKPFRAEQETLRALRARVDRI